MSEIVDGNASSTNTYTVVGDVGWYAPPFEVDEVNHMNCHVVSSHDRLSETLVAPNEVTCEVKGFVVVFLPWGTSHNVLVV